MEEDKYYSIDNQEFDTLEDRDEYEDSLNRLFNSVVFLDYSQRRLNVSLSNFRRAEDAAYIYIKDAVDCSPLFRWLSDYSMFESDAYDIDVKNGDVLIWDHENDEWYNANNRLKDIESIIREISSKSK